MGYCKVAWLGLGASVGFGLLDQLFGAYWRLGAWGLGHLGIRLVHNV